MPKQKSDYHRLRAEIQGAFEDQAGRGSDDARLFCPVCFERTGKDDTRGSLSVNHETGFFKCWKCEFIGRLEGFEDDDDDYDRPPPPPAPVMTLPRDFEPLMADMMESYLFGRHARYVRDRGLPFDIVERARMGVAGGRLIVPVTTGGDLRGWVGRIIPGVVPAFLDGVKYVYPKGFKRADLVYNEDAIDAPGGKPLIVVEGVFDALPHWPHAVACLGKPAGQQLEIVARTKRPVIVVMDADAWEVGRAFADQLYLRGVPASWLHLPHGLDPGMVSSHEMSAWVQAASQHPGQGFEITR